MHWMGGRSERPHLCTQTQRGGEGTLMLAALLWKQQIMVVLRNRDYALKPTG